MERHFAGAVLASAIAIVLLRFKRAIGLATTSPLQGDGYSLPVRVFSSGLWIMWAQITASIGGGYLAGRLRAPLTEAPDHEREVRDGTHGLLTWATATVAVFVAVSAASALAALVTNHPDHASDLTAQMIHTKKNATVIFAFAAAAISLVSATAAWWAAVKGGEHRDNSTDFSHHYSFLRGNEAGLIFRTAKNPAAKGIFRVMKNRPQAALI